VITIGTLETSSLGNRSYVVADGEVAVVLDPQRHEVHQTQRPAPLRRAKPASDLPQPCARPEGFEPATF